MDEKILQESYTLSNGVKIPQIGLGTWMIDDDRAAEAVRNAVALGYRHIDTAEAYGNEQGVGEGIRNYGEAAIFPVYGGKMNSDGTYTARYFYKGAGVS